MSGLAKALMGDAHFSLLGPLDIVIFNVNAVSVPLSFTAFPRLVPVLPVFLGIKGFLFHSCLFQPHPIPEAANGGECVGVTRSPFLYLIP